MTTIIQFSRYGDPDVLELAEVPTPRPGPGELRVRVHAAGVQPFDCATRRGDFQRWNPLPLPARLGNEVAGVVDAVGAGTRFAPGDEVIAYLDLAGYATDVVVPAEQAVAKPAGMSWEQAGGLAVAGQTASTAVDALELRPGDTVLIHAAAGGVGSSAVQLARVAGARVIGTASPGNHAYLAELGALPVAYGPGLSDRVRAVAPAGITAALDAIGGDALDASLELLGSPARIVTVADIARHQQLGIRRIGTDRSHARLARLADLVSRGALRVEVGAGFPLARAADAHRRVESGHGRGKTVLLPQQ